MRMTEYQYRVALEQAGNDYARLYEENEGLKEDFDESEKARELLEAEASALFRDFEAAAPHAARRSLESLPRIAELV